MMVRLCGAFAQTWRRRLVLDMLDSMSAADDNARTRFFANLFARSCLAVSSTEPLRGSGTVNMALRLPRRGLPAPRLRGLTGALAATVSHECGRFANLSVLNVPCPSCEGSRTEGKKG